MVPKNQQAAIAFTAAEKKRFCELLGRFKRAKVLVVGDLILDQFVWGKVERISPEAPVPVVNVQRESYMPGGSLNVANNIHELGGGVYPCGVVGRDLAGRMLLKMIRKEGIETGGIVYDPARPTSLKTRVIAHSQQVVRFDREKSGDISPELSRKILRFLKQKIRSCDAVVIEDYGKGVIQSDFLKKIVSMARAAKKPVLVDPKEKHFPHYLGVTAITPNRKEAYGAMEHYQKKDGLSLEQVGQTLLTKLRCQAVLITLGEDGMALFQKGKAVVKIPTFAREVYDVSGAGDTVIAVLGLALAAGAKMAEAAVLANLAAGIVVGKLGTATVSPKELEDAIWKAGAR